MSKHFSKKSLWKPILKILLVVTLFYFMVQKDFISLEKTGTALKQYHYMIPAWILLCLAYAVSVFRWHLLLRAQGIHITTNKTFQLGLIGAFFSTALPGVISGDVVKAYYVAQQAPGKKARALSSILFDRVAGVSGLVLVATLVWLTHSTSDTEDNALQLFRVFLACLSFGVIFFFSYLLLIREGHDPVLKLLSRWEKRSTWGGSLFRIYDGIREYHHQKKQSAIALLLSVFVHLFTITACVQFTRALGETHVPFQTLFIIVPIGLLVTAVPVMPGGIGTGHAAFLYLYRLAESQRGMDVFNLYLIFQIFTAVIGAVVYILQKNHSLDSMDSIQKTSPPNNLTSRSINAH